MGKEVFDAAKQAGVYTLDDLREFVAREKQKCETLLQALKRYAMEVQNG